MCINARWTFARRISLLQCNAIINTSTPDSYIRIMPYAPCQHTLNTLSQLCLASAIIEPAGRVRQMVSANAMHIVRRAAGNYTLNEAGKK